VALVQPSQESEEVQGYRREDADFENCKPGHWCIGACDYARELNGRNKVSDGIFVAKIDKIISQEEKTFTVKSTRCTVDPWNKLCLQQGKWNLQPHKRNSPLEEMSNTSVFHYFTKLTQKKKLPKATVDVVHNCVMEWDEEESDSESE
jgi:hypothetical protein